MIDGCRRRTGRSGTSWRARPLGTSAWARDRVRIYRDDAHQRAEVRICAESAKARQDKFGDGLQLSRGGGFIEEHDGNQQDEASFGASSMGQERRKRGCPALSRLPSRLEEGGCASADPRGTR